MPRSGTAEGGVGRSTAIIGMAAKLIANATLRRIRIEKYDVLNPGKNAIAVPTRAKINKNPKMLSRSSSSSTVKRAPQPLAKTDDPVKKAIRKFKHC